MLHVTTQGAALGQAGGRLELRKDDTVLLSVPIAAVGVVFLYGDVRPTKGAVRLCLDENVGVVLLTRQGRFRGRLAGKGDDGLSLRQCQWSCAGNTSFCLSYSRLVVRRKLESSLETWQLRRQSPGSTSSTVAALRQAMERIPTAASLDSLRGMEGTAARAWFAQMRAWLPRAWNFAGRDRTHADPANALLNLGYTLLCHEWESHLAGAGFEPGLGFYHSPKAGRPSLACDLMEEFRPRVVDRVVLNLANRSILRPSDFEQRESGMRLKQDALRVFLRAYEEVLLPERQVFSERLVELERRLRATKLAHEVERITPRSESRIDVEDVEHLA